MWEYIYLVEHNCGKIEFGSNLRYLEIGSSKQIYSDVQANSLDQTIVV